MKKIFKNKKIIKSLMSFSFLKKQFIFSFFCTFISINISNFRFSFFNKCEKIHLDFIRFILLLKLLSISSLQYFIDASAIDKVELKCSGIKQFWENPNRFCVFYHFLSIFSQLRVVFVLSWDILKKISTLSSIFLGSSWVEREIWDMFGIFFYNHLDLRRILTDYGFIGFPLRKDFPVVGFLEVQYNSEVSNVLYSKLSLSQENRFFDIFSVW